VTAVAYYTHTFTMLYHEELFSITLFLWINLLDVYHSQKLLGVKDILLS